MAVVVTGASSGLGTGFAQRFAARGTDVVLVARRRERLDALAAELRDAHKVEATPIVADLGEPDAPGLLAADLESRGIAVTGLVNSAGFGTAGPFTGEDPARIAAEIQLNVTALTVLTRLLLPALIEAKGLLVNVSSNASHQPLPGFAVYAATKAYVTSLTEAIWQETRGTGLKVLALCPGPTETEFFEAAGTDAFKVGRIATAAEVLDVAFAALDGGDPGPVRSVGTLLRIQGWTGRVAPRRFRLAVAAKIGAASRSEPR